MTRKDMTIIVTGLVLCGLSIFLAMSLVSYSPVHVSAEGGAAGGNVCGTSGHFLARHLVRMFGWSAFFVPLMLAYWTVIAWVRRPVVRLWIKVIGSILLVFVCAAIESLFSPAPAGSGATPPGGGMAGYFIWQHLLRYQNTFGAGVICALFLAASLLFITDNAGLRAAGRLLQLCRRGIVALKDRIAAWVRRRRELAAIRRAAEGEEDYDEDEDFEEEIQPKLPTARELAKQAKKEKKKKKKTKIDIARKEEKRTQPKTVAVPKPRPRPAPVKEGEYILPEIDLLEEPGKISQTTTRQFIQQSIETLNRSLEDFGVDAAVVDYRRGPAVTMFELELAPGIKVHKVMALANDLAMALKVSGLRVVAPIPGKSTVGIEVPNSVKELVRIKELMQSETIKDSLLHIPIMLGKDTSGQPLIEDLSRMPHMLIAGTTGSGKSVCISSIILSVLFTRTPDEVNLIMIDPKMVELSAYKDIPHLITPVVTDMKKAPSILDWATRKMDQRYELLARAGVRHINDYNRLGEKKITEIFQDAEEVGGEDVPFHLPFIILIIDELADLMMVAAKETQNYITRLAQKSRAVGIHAIMATQRPSVDVITGLIKSNIPARIAFQVASKVDSRTIIDRNGAETLLGGGDMLFLAPGTSALSRAQGCFVSDAEIKRVVAHVRTQGQPRYSRELSSWTGETQGSGQTKDDLYEEAVCIVLESQRGSVSLLQRRLEIGYTRAARLIDMMAADGLVGDYKGSKAREVLVSLEEWEARRM